MDSPQTSTTVDRVLHVLAGVARAGKPVSAKQIAAMVQQPVSTVYRHLASLKKWGLLQEHMNSGTFEPGPTGVQLAWGFDQNSNLISQSRDEISALVERSGESVGLLVHINGEMVCIAMEESTQPLRCSFTKGRSHKLHKGASAKSLLAFMPRKQQQKLLAEQLGDKPEEVAALEAQLDTIRRRGYSTSDSEVDLGVWGVSVPIMTSNSRLEGTITLMAPALRVGAREQELIRMTVEAAQRICNRY